MPKPANVGGGNMETVTATSTMNLVPVIYNGPQLLLENNDPFIDGLSYADDASLDITDGDIILLKDQTNKTQNGPWMILGIDPGTGSIALVRENCKLHRNKKFSTILGDTNAGKDFIVTTKGKIVCGQTDIDIIENV